MGVLVVVLCVLVAVLGGATAWAMAAMARLRRREPADGADGVDVFEAPRPAGVTGRDRRLITIEILNPIELATARAGRVAGLAGSLAPGLTRKLVYDQTLRTLRRELDEQNVLADVRVHTLRRVRGQPGQPPAGSGVIDAVVVDEVAPLDLREPG